MSDIPLSALFGALIALLAMSAFFSGSETALMSINRYRLRHLSRTGHAGAVRASWLLDRPDRLIGLILLGNTFANIAASSISTIIALRFGGDSALAIAAGVLTLVMLIFSEVAPKTLGALHPEPVAFFSAYVYQILLKLLQPLVWAVNATANGVLRLIGIDISEPGTMQHLTSEELRTVVNEAGALIPKRHQNMLLSVLDLGRVTVNDIMVPRNDVVGIDIDQEWDEILNQLRHSQHSRLPVYHEDLDRIVGFVHMRNVVNAMAADAFDRETFMSMLREPYFIPENTPLNTQLLNFQRQGRRIGVVVDEYGDIQGVATLEDILEEIVGEFTTDPSTIIRDVHPQADGSYIVDGAVYLRDLNKMMRWNFPTDGPKTLSGLIIEYLETIPETGTSVKIGDYPVEIVQVKDNIIKTVRIMPYVAVTKA
ncbi:MAG: HlyC/CorC family transporter [Gammaproteobacteria bacterium]|nr:HlyC/CorC family transporter [Gammaproteobacteria bacterium]